MVSPHSLTHTAAVEMQQQTHKGIQKYTRIAFYFTSPFEHLVHRQLHRSHLTVGIDFLIKLCTSCEFSRQTKNDQTKTLTQKQQNKTPRILK